MIFRFIFFLAILLLLLTLSSFVFTSIFRKYFPTMSLKRLFVYNVIGNALYLALFIAIRFIESAYSLLIVRFLNYYLAFALYALLLAILYWVIYLVAKLARKEKLLRSPIVLRMIVVFLLIIFLVGVYNFEKPIAVEKITLDSDKITMSYKFVHVTDTQYGTTSQSHLETVMELAYEQNPDFIVFTGDLIDSDYYVKEDFAIFAKTNVPIYFERGNHEFYHDPSKLLGYLDSIPNIHLLLNQKSRFGEIDLVGIDYTGAPNQVQNVMKTLKLDDSQYSILLYHAPNEVEVAASHGFDLQLYGHTHAGQIWPITTIIDSIYEYGDGLYQLGTTYVYTSDGAGLWGPRLRLDSQNEIVLFTIKPTK